MSIQRIKLTGAAILVSRGMKDLQAAPAAYPYRSPKSASVRNWNWQSIGSFALLTVPFMAWRLLALTPAPFQMCVWLACLSGGLALGFWGLGAEYGGWASRLLASLSAAACLGLIGLGFLFWSVGPFQLSGP